MTDISSTSSSSLFPTINSSNTSTTSTTTSTQPNSASELANISQEITQLSQQVRDAQAQADAETNENVFVFEKRTGDIVNDSLQFARDIGVLIKDNSRLNIITNFQKEESADYFRFRITKPGEVRLNSISQLDFQTEAEVTAAERAGNNAQQTSTEEDESVDFRIQLFTRNGRLLADNEGTREDLRDVFAELDAGTYQAKAGDYVVKVSRAQQDRGNEEIQYAVQLTQGGFKNDFDTIEAPYAPGSLPVLPDLPTSTVELLDGLTQGLAFIGNLPPIGQSATDKLTGALTDLFI